MLIVDKLEIRNSARKGRKSLTPLNKGESPVVETERCLPHPHPNS